MFFLCCRHSSQLSKQLAWVTHLPVRLRALGRWMHHLLWEYGRHSHLLLWTHVSLLFMWAEAQEDGQCLLPHLQTGHQRYHQNISQHLEQQQMPWWDWARGEEAVKQHRPWSLFITQEIQNPSPTTTLTSSSMDDRWDKLRCCSSTPQASPGAELQCQGSFDGLLSLVDFKLYLKKSQLVQSSLSTPCTAEGSLHSLA